MVNGSWSCSPLSKARGAAYAQSGYTPSAIRVRSKITSDFGGSAAWPDARREEGASPPAGCDRRATKQLARRRPAPEGWGCLAVWRRCSLLTDRWRVCSSLAPSQTAKQPPAKSEFIFEQTLSPYPRRILPGTASTLAWFCLWLL